MKKVILVITVLSLTACAQLIGIKRYQSGDTILDFNTGIGLSADVTQSDTLNMQRSIKPN